jgi:uncharacterized RDD family membrane protein YckC
VIPVGVLLGDRETACLTNTSEYCIDEFCTTGASTLGQPSFIIALLVSIVYIVWKNGYRQGTTGSSIGKSIMKFKLVSEKTRQPIGFGKSIVRQLAHIIDGAICLPF